MDLSALRDYCLSLPDTSEGFPFNEHTLVIRVVEKIFLITDIQAYQSLTLKCDPSKALMLRERYEAIKPGFHMNKKHWNTIHLEPSISESLLRELILDSYHLVRSKQKKKLSATKPIVHFSPRGQSNE